VPLLRDPSGAQWRDEAYAEFHGQRYFFTQRILWRGDLKYILNAFDFDEMYDLAADPAELNNVAADPAYAARKEEMLQRIWRSIHATGDRTLAEAQYWTLRFFDLGPDCVAHD
jgi:arylsulfatase A-like enzyme